MGPLKGLKIVEMSGIGPAPFCGMLLADLGADVIRVDRPSAVDLGFNVDTRFDFLNRSKRAVALDLKSPEGVDTVKTLIASADMLIEGFRPGVMERLGLGPDVCHALNPRLIYGRMTGWGQDGPYRDMAGHDINYIGLAGALASIGEKGGDPVVPLNLIGDFGGGSLYLAMGLLAALHDTRASGMGQVVDAAMVDGVASLLTMHHGMRQAGLWNVERGANPLDGAAPYYRAYKTSDGGYMAVGAVENRFYRDFVRRLGLNPDDLPGQNDTASWPELAARFAAVFAEKTRAEWEAVYDGADACVSPVLDLDETVTHPMAEARGMFRTADGVYEPNPAPRFSRTPAEIRNPPLDARADTRSALLDWGLPADRIDRLAEQGVIARG